MKSWSIGKRLGVNTALAFATALGLGITSWVSIHSLQQQIDRAYDREALKLMLAGNVDASTHEMAFREEAALSSAMQQNQAKYTEDLRRFAAAASEAQGALGKLQELSDNEGERVAAQKLTAALADWNRAHSTLRGMIEGMRLDEAIRYQGSDVNRIMTQTSTTVDRLVSDVRNAGKANNNAADDVVYRSYVLITSLIIASIIVGVFNGRAIWQISKQLWNAVVRLGEASDQVASASDQIASMSQALAQGASEQAASLEETSASTEEISSMARRNAEHCTEAANMALDSRDQYASVDTRLHKMVAGMEDIAAASNKISKIIKVIDEIAFQTNILALNAAVEAARAGEAGAGFAVVADEVRSLAQRCAEAARETATLIEQSVQSAADGKRRVDQVVSSITDITTAASKINTLIEQVNSASQEQTRGIDQVAGTLTQMQQITQQSAASAEQGASASQELTAQSADLRQVVGQLQHLVGSTASSRT